MEQALQAIFRVTFACAGAKKPLIPIFTSLSAVFKCSCSDYLILLK